MKLNEVILMVCLHLRNAFEADVERGGIHIQSGNIALDGDFQYDDWVAIVGSRRNNGIYKLAAVPEIEMPLGAGQPLYRLTNGTDEDAVAADEQIEDGAVHRLQFPMAFLRLCEDVSEWMAAPQNAPKSAGVQSENVIGFYSWSKGTGANGATLGWHDVFASRMPENWRKMWQSSLVTALSVG